MKYLPLLLLPLLIHAAELPKPRSHWRFDETGKKEVSDSSGSATGSISREDSVEGISGKAFHFAKYPPSARNKACSVVLPLAPEQFIQPFTFTLWFKLDKENSYSEFKDIIGNCGDRGPGFRITYFYNCLCFRTGDGKAVQEIKTNAATINLPAERWIHLAAVYDGKTASLYLDGALVATGPLTLTKAARKVTVGSITYGYAYPLQGSVDEVKFFDSPLTSEEVAEIYFKELR